MIYEYFPKFTMFCILKEEKKKSLGDWNYRWALTFLPKKKKIKIKKNIYIYRERERWVQVTHIFKLLDLSRSNDQKKTLINANILIKISLIIPYLLYFISIFKPRNIWLSLSTFLSLPLSPSPLFHLHG